MNWGMVSNGWFYDEDMHARLMGAGMGALTISLDGLEDAHDWMRGRVGSYSRTDSLWDVWENRFREFRDRRWTRTGSCATCREWKNCRGGDMHNWHDGHLLQCHYAKTLSTP